MRSWRASPRGEPALRCLWILRPLCSGYQREREKCSSCTMSRAIATKRSPKCLGSQLGPRNRSCTGREWQCASTWNVEGSVTMTDRWTDRLSEYLDGDLPDNERVALEAHLQECAECPGVLADLRQVVSRAHGLQPLMPAQDLWPAIAR